MILLEKNIWWLVEFWYPKVIEILCNDIIIGVLGNKSDLIEKKDISIDKIKKFVEEKKLIFKEISATNHYSISNFIEELVQFYYDKYKDYF